MTRNTSKATGKVGAVAALCLMAALLTPSSALADSAPGLVGAWRVQVTLRNCSTRAPLGPPFHALVSFHRGGTISESAGGVTFAPGQRSAGHGAWARKSGHTYQQDMVAMIVFDTEPNLPGTPTFDPTKPVSPGFFAGWSTVSHTVQFTDEDHISSEGTNAFYKLSGEVYRTGCSTATGERF
jgi:hypothetical protein